MKIFFILSVIIYVLFTDCNLYASSDNSLLEDEKIMREESYSKITEKVIVFLQQNPSKNHLTLKGLLQEKVISEEDYKYLIKNKIKYNPPSSAGPYDTSFSIFDRKNEDGTSSHVVSGVISTELAKTGTITDLERFISEWYGYNSTQKSLFLFRDNNLHYFTLCYWDNDSWDNQHIMLVNLPGDSIDEIEKFKKLIIDSGLKYREYNQENISNFTVWLPSDLSFIKKLSNEILISIYKLSKEDVITYMPDGFRFGMPGQPVRVSAAEQKMNVIVKYLTFYPTMYKYLKGNKFFYAGKYEQALKKFEACKKHPYFQNELFFSYYGQTLCALGRLREGHPYLIKACKKYEEESWVFKNDYTLNLAQNTLNALDHVIKHTSITDGTEYLGNELKFQKK